MDSLIEKGCRVRVVDNLVNGKLENLTDHLRQESFEFFRRDVTDPLDVERTVEEIDVVFHLACLGVRHSLAHPFDNHRVNAEGSLLVLDAAFRAKVDRFIYCSSSEVYGTAQYIPMPESHPTHPCTVYGSGKLAGEAYARAYYKTYEMPTVVVRPFNTYGPRSHYEGDAGEMIPKSIIRALNGEQILIFGDGNQTRDFTYVEDMAEALVCAAESDAMIGQTLNVGSNFEISMKDLAHKIADMVGNPDTLVSFGPERPGDVLRLYADAGKFMELSDWEPRISLDEGLAKTIEFFRSHPVGLKGLMESERGRNWEGDY